MSHKLLTTIVAISALVSLSSAQNARISSLGNCEIADDIANVIYQPAFMNDYPDAIQATGGTTNDGLLIGIKSVGDMIRIGTIANTGSMLTSPFYTRGITALNAFADPNLPAGDFPPIPHLLFGLDLDAVKIGVDLFCEYRSTKSIDETTRTTPGGTTVTTASAKARIYNVGLIANAILSIGDLAIIPLVGIGRPAVSAESRLAVTGNTDVVNEVNSEKGLFGRGGLEVDLPLLDLTWKIGGLYNYETYQFVTTTGGTETRSNEYSNHSVLGYAGFVGDITDDIYVTARYGLGLTIDKAIDITTETTTRSNFLTHYLSGGLERPVGDVWVFDQVIPRAGVDIRLTRPITHVTVALPTTNSTTDSRSANDNSINPTFGLGLEKGRVMVDVYVNIGSWVGVVAGPAVMQGSVTVDFGNN